MKSDAIKIKRSISKYIAEHPIETLATAATAVSTVTSTVLSIKENSNKNINTNKQNTITTSSTPPKIDIKPTLTDDGLKPKRKPPIEHVVSACAQIYHTKNGDVLKYKKSFTRGGNKKP